MGTIIQKGRVSRPIIGITFLESARANTVGIQKGVLVLDVAENTSAARSGLRPTTRTQVISHIPVRNIAILQYVLRRGVFG